MSDPDLDAFNTALEAYKTNYLQFIQTGAEGYKTAYQNALNIVTEKIRAKKIVSTDEQTQLNNFLNSYKSSQEGINDLQENSEDSLKKINKLTNEYETVEKQFETSFNSDCGKVWWKPCPPRHCDDTWWNPCPHPEPHPTPGEGVSRGYEIMLRLGILLIVIVFFFIGGYYFQTGAPDPYQQAQQAVQQVANVAFQALSGRPTSFGTPAPMRR